MSGVTTLPFGIRVFVFACTPWMPPHLEAGRALRAGRPVAFMV